MAATEVSGLSKQDVDKMLKQIKLVKDVIKIIEDLGGEVPKALTTSLNRLEMAIKAGKAVAEAADEAQEALEKYTDDLMSACKTVDQEMQAVCEAQVTRKWQARSVNFVLSYKNPDSVTSNVIRKIVQKLTPKVICKHWAYCAKNAKDD
jgi:hypothetical protein